MILARSVSCTKEPKNNEILPMTSTCHPVDSEMTFLITSVLHGLGEIRAKPSLEALRNGFRMF